jgi:hypothetical protein
MKKIIEIHTVPEIFYINKFIDNYNASDYVVKIMNNLDFKDVPWIPIGYKKARIFAGEFDGQRYILKNLKMNLFPLPEIGLIYRNCGYVHDVYLDNTCQITGSDYVGSICAINEGVIANCKSAATIEGHNYIGGICGKSIQSTSNTVKMENNSFYGKIEGLSKIGGICGDDDESYCYNLTNVGLVNGKDRVGGICGNFGGISCDSKNMGSIKGDNWVGGIFGFVFGGNSKNLENYGTVKSRLSQGDIIGGKL